MSDWQKTPPNHKQWLDSDNDGHWWVRFLMVEREEEIDDEGKSSWWPEVWCTEIVSICDEMTGSASEDGRLVAHGGPLLQDRFYLDDQEATKNMYWQPVMPPTDNVDGRPTID